jgi:hypothetical protein
VMVVMVTLGHMSSLVTTQNRGTSSATANTITTPYQHHTNAIPTPCQHYADT